MRSLYRKANVLYVPALLLFLGLVVFPFFDGIRISFTNWDGYSQEYSFIGLGNLSRLADDENVRTAFWNTLLYGFGSTFLQQILGLGCAVLLDKPFRGRTAARTILYLPVLVSAVIMAYMWSYLFEYDGALNDIVRLLGGERVLWLSTSGLTVGVLIAVNTLQYMGVSMVIYMAGLQSIPSVYYEVAELEGATAWQLFRHVTVPFLYPAFVTSITVNLIGGLKLFDVIRALTNGGPGYTTHSLSTLIYSSYFESQLAGFASAIGLLLFVTVLFCALALQAFFKRVEVTLS
jgi:raffinose/stachyose/melibiose transport system permease protein